MTELPNVVAARRKLTQSKGTLQFVTLEVPEEDNEKVLTKVKKNKVFPMKSSRKKKASKVQISDQNPEVQIVPRTSNYNDDDDEEEEKKMDPKAREMLKKRNMSTMSLFIRKLIVVPDPYDDIGYRIRTLSDIIMSLYFTIITLSLVSMNVALYLLYFLEESVVSKEGNRFLHKANFLIDIWTAIFLPGPMAFILILYHAVYHPIHTANRYSVAFILSHYSIISVCVLYLVWTIFYWTSEIRGIRAFVEDSVWTSFRVYVSDNNEAVTRSWDFTQTAFECCGVNSSLDFIGTRIIRKAIRYCMDAACNRTYLLPIIETAYPSSCCNIVDRSRCVQAPRLDQSWRTGCLEKTVTWITVVTQIIVVVTAIILILIVVTTLLVIRMDVWALAKTKPKKKTEIVKSNYNVVKVETVPKPLPLSESSVNLLPQENTETMQPELKITIQLPNASTNPQQPSMNIYKNLSPSTTSKIRKPTSTFSKAVFSHTQDIRKINTRKLNISKITPSSTY